MSEYYIIVNAPAVFTNHLWSLKDSIDGVKYSSFDDAVKIRNENGIGWGIARVTEKVED